MKSHELRKDGYCPAAGCSVYLPSAGHLESERAAGFLMADVNQHGEVQPRLPGDVGAVRELEISTAPIAELPFSLTPPTNHQNTFTPSLFPACDIGDWEAKTGRITSR